MMIVMTALELGQGDKDVRYRVIESSLTSEFHGTLKSLPKTRRSDAIGGLECRKEQGAEGWEVAGLREDIAKTGFLSTDRQYLSLTI